MADLPGKPLILSMRVPCVADGAGAEAEGVGSGAGAGVFFTRGVSKATVCWFFLTRLARGLAVVDGCVE